MADRQGGDKSFRAQGLGFREFRVKSLGFSGLGFRV